MAIFCMRTSDFSSALATPSIYTITHFAWLILFSIVVSSVSFFIDHLCQIFVIFNYFNFFSLFITPGHYLSSCFLHIRTICIFSSVATFFWRWKLSITASFLLASVRKLGSAGISSWKIIGPISTLPILGVVLVSFCTTRHLVPSVYTYQSANRMGSVRITIYERYQAYLVRG